MASLLDIVRNRFLEAVRSVEPGQWKALVVDEHSKRLLGTVLKNNDILAERVTVIDEISTYREPQPTLDAMYLLMPTTKNVDRLISEYSNGKMQYKRAHLFFIDGLGEDLFAKLTASPAEPYLVTLQELYINFWALEAQVFSVKMPSLFFSLYSPPRNLNMVEKERLRFMEDLRFTSKMIANLCITLREYPYIRYYIPLHHSPLGILAPNVGVPSPPPNAVQNPNAPRWKTNLARGEGARQYEAREKEFATKLLAWMVQDALDDYKNANPDYAKATDLGRQRSTLIITERAMDTLAPFVHEFTYQAMANELLPIDDGVRYDYKFESNERYETKTATLSDADSIWTEIRHLHMSEAIDKLKGDFSNFLREHAGFKGEGVASLDVMKDMLASLPQYQEQREKFSVHLNMAQECMDLFEKRKLPAVANIEQNCATGITADGKVPKTLVEEMVPLLDSKEVIGKDKVRIIALYIQHRDGVPDEDRRRLYQHARLSMTEQDAVNGLVHLGVRISRGPSDKDIKRKLKSKPAGDDEFELSRYKPVLMTVIEDQVANKLDSITFPYVRDTPEKVSTAAGLRAAAATSTPTESLRSQKPSWHRAASKSGATSAPAIRQRLIIFVAGGMTYSEMRTAYQLSSKLNKDIYIGSSHIITPDHFIDDLKVVDLGGVGSHAAPNGLRDRDMPHDKFQEYYDEVYYTKDPTPPPLPKSQPHSTSRLLTEKIGLPGSRPTVSPSNSTSSAISGTGSTRSNVLTKEKKKKGLFHF